MAIPQLGFVGMMAMREELKTLPIALKIIKEYTEKSHLLEANKWYHVKITSDGFRTQYFINGERLVDYRDPEGLTEGYFGFRTTLSRIRFANFRCEEINVARMLKCLCIGLEMLLKGRSLGGVWCAIR